MFLLSRRVAVVLALVAATALLAPAAAATTDTMVTDNTAEETSMSDMTMDMTDEEETDEPVDSGLECSDDFAADGQCDDVNNTAACGYDGGDCCSCTCAPTLDFNCGGNYNCIDPDAECVNDDDGDGGVMTSEVIETDDATEDAEEADADADADATDADAGATDTDAAAGKRPVSVVCAGLAAAAGSAALLVGWGL